MIAYEQGKLVIHKNTQKRLWMLKEGREQILCRTEDLREVWFYPEELIEPTSTIRSTQERFL